MITVIDETLQSAVKYLEKNIANLESGNDVDMKEFDNKARIFCDALKKLPASEAKIYDNILKNMIINLTEVTNKLEIKKNELGDQINALNTRQTAYNAYGNAMFLALQAARSEE